MVFEQIDFINIEKAAISARQQTGLEGFDALREGTLQIEGADHFFKDEEAHMTPMISTVSSYVKRRLTEASR